MKVNLSIQMKAAFLLTVFFMNTVIGFACAIKCSMDAENFQQDKGVMVAENTHHHTGCSDSANEKSEQPQKGNNNNCCHDKVTAIALADKALPQVSALVHPIFFAAFATAFYNANVFYLSQVSPDFKYFVRSHHPPITDIRTAIHSYQI